MGELPFCDVLVTVTRSAAWVGKPAAHNALVNLYAVVLSQEPFMHTREPPRWGGGLILNSEGF